MKAPTATRQLTALVRNGEGPTLEFKRSTGELKEAMQTICAFLNTSGGTVLFGVRPDGRIVGQQVSDQTLRDIAQAAKRFDPSPHLEINRIKFGPGLEVVAIAVEKPKGDGPYSFDGRTFERVTSTTQRMSQARQLQILLARRGAWEGLEAKGITPRDLDREEAFRAVEWARSAGRFSGPIPRNLMEVLDRLRVRQDGRILQAAVVLFGKDLTDYPQCEIRMARFRGTDNAEFLDQKELRGPAIKLLEEAEVFCRRHFPLPGKIVPGKLRRQEKPLIPPDAMREILVNALIHRDYSIVGANIALAIYDDRVEVWSPGSFLPGITPRMLTRKHLSVRRNPIIAEVFNRAGLIEQWGRGTNRVIEMCRKHGIKPPTFEEVGLAALVTFRAPVGSTVQVAAPVAAPVTAPVETRILNAAADPKTREELQAAAGIQHKQHFLAAYLQPLLEAGLLERTIPDKPNSRLQKYRLTKKGRRFLT